MAAPEYHEHWCFCYRAARGPGSACRGLMAERRGSWEHGKPQRARTPARGPGTHGISWGWVGVRDAHWGLMGRGTPVTGCGVTCLLPAVKVSGRHYLPLPFRVKGPHNTEGSSFPMKGSFLEEVTHRRGWAYSSSEKAPFRPPQHHSFAGVHVPSQGPWFKSTPRSRPEERPS